MVGNSITVCWVGISCFQWKIGSFLQDCTTIFPSSNFCILISFEAKGVSHLCRNHQTRDHANLSQLQLLKFVIVLVNHICIVTVLWCHWPSGALGSAAVGSLVSAHEATRRGSRTHSIQQPSRLSQQDSILSHDHHHHHNPHPYPSFFHPATKSRCPAGELGTAQPPSVPPTSSTPPG